MFKKLSNLFGSKNDDEKKISTEIEFVEDDFFDDEEEDDNDDYEVPESEKGQQTTVELDPQTLHGLHYTLEEFDAEVEKRVQEFKKYEQKNGVVYGQEDVDNLYFNFRREVYKEWTGANSNMMLQWENINSQAMTGQASYGYTQHDNKNPLLEAVHGISLKDYAAAAYFISTGTNVTAIIEKLGVERAAWDEAQALWNKRMEEDTTFTVTTLFSQYFGTAENHPKLNDTATPLSAKGQESIDKMMTDRFVYIEAHSAVIAAYDYGIDGTQWLKENYDITNGDLQKVASHYGMLDSQNVDLERDRINYKFQEKKTEEYKQKFAEEQGGNIADDIDF